MKASELKVGDRVAWGRSHHWGSVHSYGFGVVSKINGHGHITVIPDNSDTYTLVFDKHGKERGCSYGERSLMAVETLEWILADTELRHATHRAVAAIQKELADHRTGHGDYHITAATKARLAELVASLPVSPE